MDASAETGTGPLEGVRVLDLSIGQMGPAATALLADFGAEVVKIESRHGHPGRGAHLPAMDMVAQGAGGLMMANAGGDADPIPVGPTIADQTGAFQLALGILPALFHRQRTGQGQKVDASLLGGMIALQGWHIAHYLMTGRMALMSSQRSQRSPLFTFYRASDGWFTIAIIDPRQWPALCRLVGVPELAEDPRFAEAQARDEHADELLALLDERFAGEPRDHWLRLLEGAEIPCGPVSSYAELVEDEQVLANGYVAEWADPRLGQLRVPGLPIKLSETPGGVRPAPELGQHTEEALEELGYSWEEIGRLRGSRTIL